MTALSTHYSFSTCVFHVLFMGANEEVRGVDTGWIVSSGAVVTDFHPIRDRPSQKFPRNAVRFKRNLTDRLSGKLPITFTFSAGPNPTSVGAVFIDVREENLFERFLRFLSSALDRTALLILLCGFEGLRALRTGVVVLVVFPNHRRSPEKESSYSENDLWQYRKVGDTTWRDVN